MNLIAVLSLIAVVNGLFDITFPKGIVVNYTRQVDEDLKTICNYGPEAHVYPWNPNGSPLALNQHVDKSLVDVLVCSGDNYMNITDWLDCEVTATYVQPFAGKVCIHNTSSEYYGDIGTNATVIVRYQINGLYEWECLPITVSSLGPTWEDADCVSDENTGFQEWYGTGNNAYGPNVFDAAFDSLPYHYLFWQDYVTYSVVHGKTVLSYDYYLASYEHESGVTKTGSTVKVDTKTLTADSQLYDIEAFTVTIDGVEMLYSGSLLGTTATHSTSGSDDSAGFFATATSASTSASTSTSTDGETTTTNASSSTVGSSVSGSTESSTSTSSSSSTSNGAGAAVTVSGFMTAVALFAAGLMW